MALRIRLARGGTKKRPHYNIVIADSRNPRDGRFIEKIGTYNPMLEKDHPQRIQINAERAKHWISVGAVPTERVALFFQAVRAFTGSGYRLIGLDHFALETDEMARAAYRVNDGDRCYHCKSALMDALEPLALSYHFDAVESEGTIRFVHRGRAPAGEYDEEVSEVPVGYEELVSV